MKQLIFICLALWLPAELFGQEVLMNLDVNPALQQEPPANSMRLHVNDTLSLPFVDDFSQQSSRPSSLRWSDASVFINPEYGYDPITFGMATFDGLDAKGKPYDFTNPTSHGSADTLTSLPIAMDTLVPGDSAFFSFYYQPTGRGNAPENNDSLLLQFSTPGVDWHTVWMKAGNDTSIHSFHKVILTIKDAKYFEKGFRFRFRNYATLSGNIDHWHIDYVYLYIPQGPGDTLANDIGWTARPTSFLKDYSSVPWKHYRDNPIAMMADTAYIPVRNLKDTLALIDIGANIRDAGGNAVKTYPVGGNLITSKGMLTYKMPVNFTFPDNGKDSADFTVTCFKGNYNDLIIDNDTVRENIHLYNYYAYDDGTAENGYGLNAVGGRIAYKFTTQIPDTLRGVQMYWNQMINNVSGISFKLTVWDGENEPGNIIYQETGNRPTYTDSLNKFHTYVLDSAIQITGTFFVGWVQVTTDLLNLGLDRNNLSNDRMFFNTTGNWSKSQIAGSWMIRPVFGDSLPHTGIKPNEATTLNGLLVFPNPASTQLNISSDWPNQTNASYEITDVAGRRILANTYNHQPIDIAELPDGIFFIRLKRDDTGEVKQSRFIKIN
ncbi:MAG: T9SS type A sorting domain-containing protein [Flavobacteriales bacterium]|nr:T9SS type A sorting domain-containing protein [Flavobacteriales bacterium]